MYNPLNKTYSGKTAENVSNVMGSYNVPKYCPPGSEGPNYPPTLNTLSHGVAPEHRHGGYFSILGAYPFAGCNSCKASRTTRPCAGVVDCGGKAVVAEKEKIPEEVKQEVEQAKKEVEQAVVESYRRRMRRRRF